MRTLIVILIAMLLNVTTINAENNSFKKAINEAKVSVKEIKKELCGDTHPKELLNIRYEAVKKEVEPSLKNIKDKYDTHSTKNAEKMSNKQFKITGIDKSIKDLISEYLNERRNVLLEKANELEAEYVDKITTEILKVYYIKNLTQAVEQTANEWLITEEKENYIPFLKMKVLHPKVKDETILMDVMATEYLIKKQEMFLKVYKCLLQTNSIIKEYKVGSVNIKHKSKYNFEYINGLESIMQSFFTKKGADKQKSKDLYKKTSKDIKELIENSTGIQ